MQTEEFAPHTEHKSHAQPKWWTLSFWAVGLGSLAWLLLRSGTKPQRASYPCQRVAAANSAGFLAYLAALLGSATLLRRLRTAFSPARLALLGLALLLTASLQGSVATPARPLLADSPELPSWTSPTAVSNVFAVANVPEPLYSLDGGDLPSGVPASQAFPDAGVEALIALMDSHGDYFYQTAAHPAGLFGPNDVIVIKVNNQWNLRNGTNTDVLKGVIYKLVQHPDTFTGSVIVAENPQDQNADWYNQGSDNNSQFQNQSYQDVVQAFAGQGYHVCISDWKLLRSNFVDDFDQGNNDSGYVLEDADSTTQEQGKQRLSYPKFTINCNGSNLSVSLKQGLWDGGAFDASQLKMINMPVLKRHNSAWATISVKNYLGFITTENIGERWSDVSEIHCWLLGPSDNGRTCPSYNESYGLIGRQLARIRRADLNIVDAIWVNSDNNLGGGSRRQDVLLASRDPFAVDYYASDYILGPLIQQYDPSADYTQAMASTHGGWFRRIQMSNVARLRAEGITDTINMDDSLSNAQELAQFNAYVADAGTPGLTLSAPNGGEVWEVGAQEQITWSSTNLTGDVQLEYSTNGFASANAIIVSTEDDGSYTWTIPNDPSTNVQVRVSNVISSVISDTSDAAFSIVAPSAPMLILSSPNGGESWQAGTQQQITWSSANLDGDLRLEYSTDGFASAEIIHDSTANDGSYTWTVPNDPSDSVQVRVSSVLTSTISDTSDAVFSITPPPAPTLTLLTPNGGESWQAGTQEQITWSSENLTGDLRLEYSTDGFASAEIIHDSTANDGSYTWTVPNDPSDSVRVRVSSVLTSTISDTSDAVFSITPPPTPMLTLLAPNGGERWEVGTQQQILWSSNYLSGYVCLEYSTDDFASVHVIDDCTPDDGQYDWTVPNTPSDNVLIRIYSLGSAAISDTCDLPFAIVGSYTVLDSFKRVNRVNVQSGETVLYTVVLYEEISATLSFSDTLPAGLTYVPGSANIEPEDKGSLLISDALYWSGTVTGTQPVTITFQAQAPMTGVAPQAIINRALISRNGETPIQRQALFFLNGIQSYLPLALHNYQD